MSRLAKNILFAVMAQGALLLVSLLAIRNVYAVLGKDVFGMILLAEVLSGALNLSFDKSVRYVIVREMSSNMERNPGYVYDLVRTYALLAWLFALGVWALAFAGAPLVVQYWLTLTQLDAPMAVRLVKVLSLRVVCAVPACVYRSFLEGIQRMDLSNAMDVGTQVVQRLGIIIIISNGGSVLHAIYWLAGSGMATAMAFAFCARAAGIRGCLVPGYAANALRGERRFSKRVVQAAVLTTIQRNVDMLILSKLMHVVMIGYYSTIQGIASKTALITNGILKAAYPSICSSYSSDNKIALKNQYTKLHDLVCLTSVPTFALAWFASFPLLSYLFGIEDAYRLLVPYFFLLLGFYLSQLISVPWLYSLAGGRPEITTTAALISLVVFAPVTLYLVWRFGLNGAGLSLVLYNVFYCLYALPVICRECLGTPLRNWIWHVGKINMGMLGSYGVVWVWMWWRVEWSFQAAAAAYLFSSIIWLCLVHRLINRDLRRALLACVRAAGRVVGLAS